MTLNEHSGDTQAILAISLLFFGLLVSTCGACFRAFAIAAIDSERHAHLIGLSRNVVIAGAVLLAMAFGSWITVEVR